MQHLNVRARELRARIYLSKQSVKMTPCRYVQVHRNTHHKYLALVRVNAKRRCSGGLLRLVHPPSSAHKAVFLLTVQLPVPMGHCRKAKRQIHCFFWWFHRHRPKNDTFDLWTHLQHRLRQSATNVCQVLQCRCNIRQCTVRSKRKCWCQRLNKRHQHISITATSPAFHNISVWLASARKSTSFCNLIVGNNWTRDNCCTANLCSCTSVGTCAVNCKGCLQKSGNMN